MPPERGETTGDVPGATRSDDAARTPARSLQASYDALLAHITGRGDAGATAAEQLVEGDPRASAAARIHVYAHMYRARIVEALASQFPRLARQLGERDAAGAGADTHAHADTFADLAAAYIADQPSRHPSLRFLGQGFPDWLAARPADDAAGAALDAAGGALHAAGGALIDLARLEWARADVFDAADETPLAIEAVRAWPAERFGEIPLRLVTAHRRLRLAHPVAALWEAAGPELPSAGAGGESLLVWRQGASVFHRVTDPAETAALETIAAGTTFGAICETLLQAHAEAQATAQAFAWLSGWCEDELLVA